ncbi:MAG: glycosyltransferase [Chitinophagales bacterium]|nr:glycosyltransferase [Hyphomicrobiales bacterium]
MAYSVASNSAAEPALLICFSQLRWNFVFQRPQHLMLKAAQTYRVVFWEEAIYSAVEAPRLDLQHQAEMVTVAAPVLPLGMSGQQAMDAQRSLLDGLLIQMNPQSLIAWYATPMMLAFSDHLKPDLTIYDNMDELSAFLHAPRELIELENELFERADAVFTGGMSIFEAKQGRHSNIHAVPSSIDKAHFHQAREWTGAEPEDQAGISYPRIGWFGVIDERFDSSLMSQLAALKPDWQFVMIGPVVKIDPSSLPQANNIHWLGQKSYHNLPAYLASWDAAIIPFAMNESTRFISPTKTPEFLAAGVPVAATPVRDIVRPYGDLRLVQIADTPQGMAEALQRAIDAHGPDALAKIDEFLADKSWDKTWSDMLAVMASAKVAKASPARLKESA